MHVVRVRDLFRMIEVEKEILRKTKEKLERNDTAGAIRNIDRLLHAYDLLIEDLHRRM